MKPKLRYNDWVKYFVDYTREMYLHLRNKLFVGCLQIQNMHRLRQRKKATSHNENAVNILSSIVSISWEQRKSVSAYIYFKEFFELLYHVATALAWGKTKHQHSK